MNTTEAMTYIEQRNALGSVLGLDNIKELLKRLGDPQDQCRVVHIAGTNGKGSILAYMDQVLQCNGYRTGRYSSPTIFTYLERFQINGRNMPEPELAGYVTRVAEAVEEMETNGVPRVTAFEIETAVAFLYFLREQVDVVLLETGMGGRLDATNVVQKPLCTILASISLDHMRILGDTVAKIAEEKAGILREGVPCVVYPVNEEALPVIRKRCERLAAPLILPDLQQLRVQSEDLHWETFDYKNVNYKISLLGEYQIYNAITALEALQSIEKQLKNGLKKVDIQKGLEITQWKGRFEVLCRAPYIIRDGAHNLDAARQLYRQITKHFTNRRILYIIGVLGDKQHKEMLRLLLPLAWKTYVLTVPENPRAYQAEALAAEAAEYCPRVEITGSPEQAYECARQEAAADDVIIAFGSLYYIGRIGE